MPRPISIIVWRDAKSDPPTGDMERYVLFVDYEQFVEMVTAREVVGACDPDALWAELPVVSDLTDEDVRLASGVLHEEGASQQYGPYLAVQRKLDAALGGGKEEADGR